MEWSWLCSLIKQISNDTKDHRLHGRTIQNGDHNRPWSFAQDLGTDRTLYYIATMSIWTRTVKLDINYNIQGAKLTSRYLSCNSDFSTVSYMGNCQRTRILKLGNNVYIWKLERSRKFISNPKVVSSNFTVKRSVKLCENHRPWPAECWRNCVKFIAREMHSRLRKIRKLKA